MTSKTETTELDDEEKYLDYDEYKELMEAYFQDRASFFLDGRMDAKVTFLVGVLSSHLISVQEKVFDSDAPIWRSFGNLHLDERKVRWLFTKVRSKLQQFSKKAQPPNKMIRLIAEYWTKAGQFKLDRIDTSWYFCIGLASRSEVSQRTLKDRYFKKKQR